MDQMSHIGDRHQGNAGPVKRASSLGGTGLGLLLTGFVFAFFFVVVLTPRLGEEFVDFARGNFHGDQGVEGRRAMRAEGWAPPTIGIN